MTCLRRSSNGTWPLSLYIASHHDSQYSDYSGNRDPDHQVQMEEKAGEEEGGQDSQATCFGYLPAHGDGCLDQINTHLVGRNSMEEKQISKFSII